MHFEQGRDPEERCRTSSRPPGTPSSARRIPKRPPPQPRTRSAGGAARRPRAPPSRARAVSPPWPGADGDEGLGRRRSRAASSTGHASFARNSKTRPGYLQATWGLMWVSFVRAEFAEDPSTGPGDARARRRSSGIRSSELWLTWNSAEPPTPSGTLDLGSQALPRGRVALQPAPAPILHCSSSVWTWDCFPAAGKPIFCGTEAIRIRLGPRPRRR